MSSTRTAITLVLLMAVVATGIIAAGPSTPASACLYPSAVQDGKALREQNETQWATLIRKDARRGDTEMLALHMQSREASIRHVDSLIVARLRSAYMVDTLTHAKCPLVASTR